MLSQFSMKIYKDFILWNCKVMYNSLVKHFITVSVISSQSKQIQVNENRLICSHYPTHAFAICHLFICSISVVVTAHYTKIFTIFTFTSPEHATKITKHYAHCNATYCRCFLLHDSVKKPPPSFCWRLGLVPPMLCSKHSCFTIVTRTNNKLPASKQVVLCGSGIVQYHPKRMLSRFFFLISSVKTPIRTIIYDADNIQLTKKKNEYVPECVRVEDGERFPPYHSHLEWNIR